MQHLPGVGRNFQDHVAFGCIWEYREPLAPRNSGSEATLYWKSRADLEAPDLLFCQLECPVPSNENATLGTPAHGWTMFAGLAHPASRGRLRLQSADPIAPLAIDANMLSDPADMQTALACVNLCRELGNASAFKHLVRGEAMPGDLSVEALTHYIRNAAVTYWHQTCTAKMGRDPMAVVDASLKVYGIKGLRVADGSVLPRLPTGNTQAPCAIIGERAAQMLTENGLLVPKPHIILLRRRSAARPHESLVSSGLRINKVNYRMEFFRLPIHRLRAAVASRAVDVRSP